MQLRYSLPTRCCRWLLPALALCLGSCSGGGPRLNPVKGTLLYRSKPLADATVSFHLVGATPDTHPSTGRTDEDGTFTLETGGREGAPAGEYKVTVTSSQQTKTKLQGFSMGEKPEVVDRFKGAFANAARSQITEVVKNGPNEFTIDLK